MLKAGDDTETILRGYSWLELEDIHACLLFGQLMERDQDLVRDREWADDVEPDIAVYEMAERDKLYPEWTEFVEPNYDAEEDMRMIAAPAGSG